MKLQVERHHFGSRFAKYEEIRRIKNFIEISRFMESLFSDPQKIKR
jgi:hypothetical protein